MRKLRVLAALLFVIGYVMSFSVVGASHETDPDIDDIDVVTPATYASCIDAEVSDTISITNVGSRLLVGRVLVQYVTDNGRELIQEYPVNQAGNLSLQVTYPPVSQWPVQSNGTAEIHVDLQIEVYDASGTAHLGVIGPEHDWDVFCLNPPTTPPTPPPSDGGGAEGCTPGYWKQDHHFDSWPTAYSPTDDFDSTFGVDLFDPDITLAEALRAKGGQEGRLARHGTAALLSAASGDVDYQYTVAEVIQLVQDGNADALAAANEGELGCPLN